MYRAARAVRASCAPRATPGDHHEPVHLDRRSVLPRRHQPRCVRARCVRRDSRREARREAGREAGRGRVAHGLLVGRPSGVRPAALHPAAAHGRHGQCLGRARLRRREGRAQGRSAEGDRHARLHRCRRVDRPDHGLLQRSRRPVDRRARAELPVRPREPREADGTLHRPRDHGGGADGRLGVECDGRTPECEHGAARPSDEGRRAHRAAGRAGAAR